MQKRIALQQFKDFENLDQRNIVKKRASICVSCNRCSYVDSNDKTIVCGDLTINLTEDYCPLSKWDEVNQWNEEVAIKRSKVGSDKRCSSGTELKKLISKLGIKSKSSCNCSDRADIMDTMGCDWCEENIDKISGWLKEEAKKRKLPFSSFLANKLVQLAIKKARKKSTIDTSAQ